MMPSSFAWLDTSPDEQRRVRELIALFTEKETIDSLGIGQIRDVFSDALFPGVSTVQTRARYFLFVPWAFKKAGESTGKGTVLEKADKIQRQTIIALKGAEERQEGIIGARQGLKVKTLPSSVYWNGLRTLGILRDNVSPGQIRASSRRVVESDESAARPGGQWCPSLPSVPDEFPERIPEGFELPTGQAGWLKERVLEAVPRSLLAALAAADRAPDSESSHPWTDSVVDAAVDGPLGTLLAHAKLFSHALHGASIFYGLAVAQAYEATGYNAVSQPVDSLRRKHEEWCSAVERLHPEFEAWNREEFWTWVSQRSSRISVPTRRFVDVWLDAVVDGSAADVDNPELQRLVVQREGMLKGSRARLGNRKLLGAWGGGVGEAMSYRWPQARRILTDIHDGLSRDEEKRASA